MNRFKSLSVVLFAAALAGVVISCDKDNENPKAEGKKAGTKMCDCVASYPAPTDPTDQAAFMEYAGQLYNCLGEIAPYSEYIGLAGTQDTGYGYDPTAENPLYSIFDFKNKDFEQGFKEGTSDCMQTFSALFALLGGQY